MLGAIGSARTAGYSYLIPRAPGYSRLVGVAPFFGRCGPSRRGVGGAEWPDAASRLSRSHPVSARDEATSARSALSCATRLASR